MLDAGFRVIRGHDLWHALDEFQRTDVRANPAGQILTSGGLDEGVAAGAEDGDEQGRLEIDFSASGIVDRNLVAGVVNEQLLSSAVFLP